MVVRPGALLFDFGGVLADFAGKADWMPALVDRVTGLTGGALSAAEIEADITAGRRAYSQWRDALARTPEPEELTHEAFWADFVAGDWPAAARAAVGAHATELVRAWTQRPWGVRPGVRESLEAARAAGVPAAVVSNTLCGAPMREFLAAEGLAEYFGVLLFSDEVGIRKPNPRFAHLALDALGVPADAAWFMDDQLSRGILCARRAGVATAVHVYDGPPAAAAPEGPPVDSDRPPARAGEEAAALSRANSARFAPDVTVPTMTAFHALLVGSLS
ncbi:hypothetical protein GCM10009682_11660 [Luedemannella flava]|uniref:HAD family hydrolase n=1 Tax=Luedemannella flava TaxID=349316 RepID=A0ABN2LK58_9ACTN